MHMASNNARKPTWLALGLVSAICLSAAAWHASAQTSAPSTQISGRARVRDGDSIRIGEERIVLWGVDAPEGDAMCGPAQPSRQARTALRRIIGRNEVQCVVREIDRHGRKVSVCSVRGRDVGAAMVEQGWARDWPRYSCGFYANQETAARAARRGVWASECPALWGNRNYAPDRCRPPPANPSLGSAPL